MTSKLRRLVVLPLVAAAAVVLMAGPATAQAPERLAAQVTDQAGVLGDRGAVDAALSDLQEKTGLQLFVVMVDSFDGLPAQEWTDETARLSDLGDRDALLAVAVGDRSYAYSFPENSRLSDRELADVAENDIEPALSRNDWSGAVTAGAQGYADAANPGGFGWVWLIVVLVAIVALAWIWLRRKRRPAPGAAPEPPSGPSLEELTGQANALLIELDDDLRAGERELALATAQYGEEATAPFQAALQTSRQDVAEAFRLRMTLEEVPVPDEARRRETLTMIIELCQGADARLDAESEAFDRLRDLEGRAAEAADEIDKRRAAIQASLPATEATAQQVLTAYSGGTVTSIATNVDQARERLSFAASALAEARAALSGAASRPTAAGGGPTAAGGGPTAAGGGATAAGGGSTAGLADGAAGSVAGGADPAGRDGAEQAAGGSA
ncbi:MAG: TPM domain-containing protein, partial [Actinomycetota bacterium]|nr:TPM domain-containing protein [Actinomycetota bacterium]